MAALGLGDRLQLPDPFVCGESDPLGARIVAPDIPAGTVLPRKWV